MVIDDNVTVGHQEQETFSAVCGGTLDGGGRCHGRNVLHCSHDGRAAAYSTLIITRLGRLSRLSIFSTRSLSPGTASVPPSNPATQQQ